MGGGGGRLPKGVRGADLFLRAAIKKQLRTRQVAAPGMAPGGAPPPASPADARDNEAILSEVRDDAVRLLLRGVQRAVTTDVSKSAAIANSPAVHTLIRRSTGWIGRLPDAAMLSVCVAGKLVS